MGLALSAEASRYVVSVPEGASTRKAFQLKIARRELGLLWPEILKDIIRN